MSPEPLLILSRSALAISASVAVPVLDAAGFALGGAAGSLDTNESLAMAVPANSIETARAAKRVILICLFISIITALLHVLFILPYKSDTKTIEAFSLSIF
jgi:hypothetical protein